MLVISLVIFSFILAFFVCVDVLVFVERVRLRRGRLRQLPGVYVFFCTLKLQNGAKSRLPACKACDFFSHSLFRSYLLRLRGRARFRRACSFAPGSFA